MGVITNEHPKCMTEISYKNTILSRQLRQLVFFGIKDVVDSLNIDWRIPTGKAILSEKDTKHLLLKDFNTPFE